MFDYLNFFHSLERFGIRPGLKRMQELVNRLGNPEKSLQFVHIAGTNGKGSTSTFIANILQTAGYKTGLFTSPYVKNFRERIQINSKEISQEALASAAFRVYEAIEELKQEGTYITEFEALTATAFLCFKDQECDLVVLEVGLGGRFDATNIIPPPLLSVITSISLDHTHILGNKIEDIALEKCGIIKPSRPVLTNNGQESKVLDTIKNIAGQNEAELVIADTKNFDLVSSDIFGSKIEYENNEIFIAMAGPHQIENALTALDAIDILRALGFKISQDDILKGIGKTRLPARVQILSRSPLIILDGAHNDGSTKALAQTIKAHLPQKRLLGLVGMMEDKDYKQAIQNLAGLFDKVITSKPQNKRALDAERLADIVRPYVNDTLAIPSVTSAFKEAKDMLKDYDGLIICGSLYLAGEILTIADEK